MYLTRDPVDNLSKLSPVVCMSLVSNCTHTHCTCTHTVLHDAACLQTIIRTVVFIGVASVAPLPQPPVAGAKYRALADVMIPAEVL